jgi:hypothetical protein
MYVAAVCLYVIPAMLILLAWQRMSKPPPDTQSSNWRHRFLIASLIAASCGVVFGSSEIRTWLHAGGNPHGMGTPPGLWIPLRWVFLSFVVATAILAVVAKGRGRLIGLCAVRGAVVSNFQVVLLDFD